MPDPIAQTDTADETAAAAGVTALADVVTRLRSANCGSGELDRQLAAALEFARAEYGGSGLRGLPRVAPWSTDLSAAFALLPPGHNFSLGDRDGVCWAWVQPNDDWQPTDGEARHDHPRGSGMVAADTPPLALTCAALLAQIKRIESRRRLAGQLDLHRLVYWSRIALTDAAPDIEALLDDILRTARHHNARNDLSGALLLFNDGCFAQVLEGGLKQLECCFEAIRRDERHCDVTLLEQAPISARGFSDWSMGFAGRLGRPEGLRLDQPDAARRILGLLSELVRSGEAWSLPGL
jgi:hypothetical protein